MMHEQFSEQHTFHTQNQAMNTLLRGEISATEAYHTVCRRLENDPEVSRLRSFRDNHESAVRYWTSQAKLQLSIPQEDSGVWGDVVNAFVGTISLLGNTPALMTLREGEKHGLENYKKMLLNDHLSSKHKDHIRQVFIPTQKEHIRLLNEMIERNLEQKVD